MEKRKEIVLFLGAGASKAFGYPITREILPKIIEGLKKKQIFTSTTSTQETKDNNDSYHFLLEELLIALSPGLEKQIRNGSFSSNEIPLVTDLLSLLDHFIANGQELKDWNYELSEKYPPKSIHARWSLRDLKVLFEYAIANVINVDKKNVYASMSNLFTWIKSMNHSKKCFVTVITSNYDFSIEKNLVAVESNNIKELIDYGFGWLDPYDDFVHLRPSEPAFRVLKLHGSVDWLKCERCSHVYINTAINISSIPFENIKTDSSSCHCGYWPLSPMLVTPSFVRGSYETTLQGVWKISAEIMRKADEWIFAGYSMPSEDFGIKSLLLRSLHGRNVFKNDKPKITVIQQSHNSQPQYDQFFGRENYRFVCGGIEAYDFEKEYGPDCGHG